MVFRTAPTRCTVLLIPNPPWANCYILFAAEFTPVFWPERGGSQST